MNLYTYQQQYARVRRYYNRFQALNSGSASIQTPGADRFDDVLSFFMHCYHLKDWLKNDPNYKRSNEEIEEYVNSNPDLALVADICNGIKHLKLNRRTHSGIEPRIEHQELSIELGPGVEDGKPNMLVRVKITITHGGKKIDAFEIASKAYNAWKKFVEEQ